MARHSVTCTRKVTHVGFPGGCKLSNSQMLHLDRAEQLGLRGGDFLGENWAQMSGTEETRRPLNTEIMAQTMAV